METKQVKVKRNNVKVKIIQNESKRIYLPRQSTHPHPPHDGNKKVNKNIKSGNKTGKSEKKECESEN